MKKIVINENQQVLMKDYFLSEGMNFFSFTMHVKDFLKQLLKNPSYAKVDEVLNSNNVSTETLLNLLKDKNIVSSSETIKNLDGKDKFCIVYTIHPTNLMKKLKRIYSTLFENNIVEGTVLEECDCSSVGGATSSFNNETFAQPVFSEPIRRKPKTIVITSGQAEKLKEAVEMGTAFGDFGYDAPPFKKKKDPSYNHKNIMKKSFNNEQ